MFKQLKITVKDRQTFRPSCKGNNASNPDNIKKESYTAKNTYPIWGTPTRTRTMEY